MVLLLLLLLCSEGYVACAAILHTPRGVLQACEPLGVGMPPRVSPRHRAAAAAAACARCRGVAAQGEKKREEEARRALVRRVYSSARDDRCDLRCESFSCRFSRCSF